MLSVFKATCAVALCGVLWSGSLAAGSAQTDRTVAEASAPAQASPDGKRNDAAHGAEAKAPNLLDSSSAPSQTGSPVHRTLRLGRDLLIIMLLYGIAYGLLMLGLPLGVRTSDAGVRPTKLGLVGAGLVKLAALLGLCFVIAALAHSYGAGTSTASQLLYLALGAVAAKLWWEMRLAEARKKAERSPDLSPLLEMLSRPDNFLGGFAAVLVLGSFLVPGLVTGPAAGAALASLAKLTQGSSIGAILSVLGVISVLWQFLSCPAGGPWPHQYPRDLDGVFPVADLLRSKPPGVPQIPHDSKALVPQEPGTGNQAVAPPQPPPQDDGPRKKFVKKY